VAAARAVLEDAAAKEMLVDGLVPTPLGRVKQDTFELALFYLDRTTEAVERGDFPAARTALQAGLAAVAAARQLFFGICEETGISDPVYAPNDFTTLEDIEHELDALAIPLGCPLPPRPPTPQPDRLPPTGTAVFTDAAARTTANRTVERVLDDEGEVAPTIAITAACIASLRIGISPREWLLRLAEDNPDDRVEHREYEHLLRNAGAVRLLVDAGWSIQTSQGTDGPAIERGPYARPTDDYLS
jgi:hypothetical protein